MKTDRLKSCNQGPSTLSLFYLVSSDMIQVETLKKNQYKFSNLCPEHVMFIVKYQIDENR